jgi:hypothetical protein
MTAAREANSFRVACARLEISLAELHRLVSEGRIRAASNAESCG